MPYDMDGQNMVFAGSNYTFSCPTATALVSAYKTGLGVECAGNALCPGGCCASRTYSVWNQDATLPAYCVAGAKEGNFFWANYKVGAAPSNFTTDIILKSNCYDNPPQVSGATLLIPHLILAVIAFLLL